ncbi:MAG TPA: BamA/TamA family outer membrane protein, partial [Anaeromyxobacteraceae bacterium]|nr:BamA/TamA family outer membrane protein [Anaeromyxobacteraceae bacterium]
TGWAKAEVEQRAQVDPTLDEAHVTYTVTPGQRYRFGPVFVAGAAVVPRSRVREEAELEVKPGATFDASELPKAQARVFDLGVFGGVRVSPGQPDEAKQQIPAVVSVREAPFRTIRAGPGFTFQATRWEADAIAGWQHRNWLGGLRRLNLDARVGYAWLPTLLNPQKSGPVALISADFTQPGVATRYVDLNLRAEVERGREQAYDFWAERLRLGTPFKLGRLVTFVPSVNLELYELGNIVTQAAVAQGASPNPQALQLTTCPGQDPSLCLLSYFEQRLVFDFRDDPINTTRGLYLALAVQEGFSVKGNGASYLRLLPEARAFVSLPFGFVLAGRGRIGVLSGSSEVPIIARFTSGGPNLMRGYYNRQLSPVLGYCPLTPAAPGKPAACDPNNFQYLPVGGAGLIDGSIELRFPIAGELGGATFLDFGDVRVKAADALNVSNLQYAVGAGIRYKTVFGPLRVDLAARLPSTSGQPGVEVLRLQSAAGCDPKATTCRSDLVSDNRFHHDPIVSFHLSIGEAF